MKKDALRSPDLLMVERYLAGEMKGSELTAFQSALEKDSGLRDRADLLRRSNTEIMKEYPPEFVEKLAAARLAAAREKKDAPGIRPGALRPLLAAASLVIVLTGGFLFTKDYYFPEPDNILIKGHEALLFIFKKGPAGPIPLSQGAGAAENDLIQISYRVPAGLFACIVSVDGRGGHTLHCPAEGSPPVKSKGGEIFLSTSYELDDAPVSEKFFLSASADPPDPEAVIRAALASSVSGSPFNPGRDTLTAEFVLRKERK